MPGNETDACLGMRLMHGMRIRHAACTYHYSEHESSCYNNSFVTSLVPRSFTLANCGPGTHARP